MLKLSVITKEGIDKDNNFVVLESFDLELEHSLASLSKWESIVEKPFLTDDEKTDEQIRLYIKLMTLTPNVPPEVFQALSTEDFKQINEYINSKQTATWFRETPGGKDQKIVTAEIIYYWMVSLGINWEAQYWHLNRLITLVRVINEKNNPEKKRPVTRDMLAERRAENLRRRAQFGTSG